MIVQTFTVDVQVLGVDMEDAAAELADDPLIVDHLQDQVRRVEVEAEILVRYDLPHLAPDSRRAREIIAAGPFVIGKQHGAVLDADLHAMRMCELDDGWPDL